MSSTSGLRTSRYLFDFLQEIICEKQCHVARFIGALQYKVLFISANLLHDLNVQKKDIHCRRKSVLYLDSSLLALLWETRGICTFSSFEYLTSGVVENVVYPQHVIKHLYCHFNKQEGLKLGEHRFPSFSENLVKAYGVVNSLSIYNLNLIEKENLDILTTEFLKIH